MVFIIADDSAEKLFLSSFLSRTEHMMFKLIAIMGTLGTNDNNILIIILANFCCQKFVVEKFKESRILCMEIFGSMILGKKIDGAKYGFQ